MKIGITFSAFDLLDAFLGYKVDFCQDNESRSSYGVLRGLHYQIAPFAQSKLVKVLEGEILDVVVDVRKESETFGKHVAIELSQKNKKQLFVPKGFAHGFLVLSEFATISYKVDAFYSAKSERGITFDDPTLNIDWRLNSSELKLSEKDLKLPLLDQVDFSN